MKEQCRDYCRQQRRAEECGVAEKREQAESNGDRSIVDPNPVGSGAFWLCRIRNICTGSGSGKKNCKICATFIVYKE
jgi:hypothetical protein